MGGGGGGSVSEQELRNVMSSSVEPEQEFKVGQDFYLECCGHVGSIIKVYGNGDIAVRCPETHEKDPLKGDPYKGKFKFPSEGSFGFSHTTKMLPTTKSNLVYIIGTR
jgi:hypothetical protein